MYASREVRPEEQEGPPAAEPPQAVAPGRVAPAQVPALQRTAGNQAVGRMHAGTPQPVGRPGRRVLQREPIRGIDQTSDTFWNDLARAAESNVQAWLTAHYMQAIEQFSDDMRPGSGWDTGEFLANSFIGLVSAIPVHGNLAAALLGMVKSCYAGITADEPMTLQAFIKRARDDVAATSDRLRRHDPEEEFFRLIAEFKASEAGGGARPEARERAKAEVAAAIAKLPRKDDMGASLTLDWIAGSQDSWDVDAGGKSAGYVFLRVALLRSPDGAASYQVEKGPFIDDAQNPDGTIAALRSAYGDAKLELLPLQMVVQVYQVEERPNNVTDRRWAAELVNLPPGGSKLRGAPGWIVTDGDPFFLSVWRTRRPTPTVNDLVADTMWN